MSQESDYTESGWRKLGELWQTVRNRIFGQNSVTLIASLLVGLVCYLTISLVPVNFVTWSPGSTINIAGKNEAGENIIAVTGKAIYPSNNQILLTTVAVTRADSRISYLDAFSAYNSKYRQVLPREFVYPAGQSLEDIESEEIRQMDSAKDSAIVAAMRASGVSVEEFPMVSGVVVTGPSNGRLESGDLILAVDGVSVSSTDAVRSEIRKHKVGDNINFKIIRAENEMVLDVPSVSSTQDAKVPAVGITLGVGYRYQPKVSILVPENIGGPSAGLAFALVIYDKMSVSSRFPAKTIAATGTITPSGDVGVIGGVREKIRGAELAGAEVFLLPKGNCQDLGKIKTQVRLIPVESLKEAIDVLAKISTGQDLESIPTCQVNQ